VLHIRRFLAHPFPLSPSLRLARKPLAFALLGMTIIIEERLGLLPDHFHFLVEVKELNIPNIWSKDPKAGNFTKPQRFSKVNPNI